MKIFLCESIHPEALALLRAHAEIISDPAQMGEADGIINRNLQLTADVLKKLPSLKAIAIHGIGTDGVDLAYCREHGIRVFNVPHENADSVAELIAALVMTLLRKLHLADRLILSAAPITNAPPELFGTELAGKTLGLIGVGDIACRAARILQDGFRMNVIGYSRSLTPERAEQLGMEYCATMEEVLHQSDVVNLGVSLNEETRGLIGAKELSQMKSSAVLINTSRGAVIDEAALYQALRDGVIAGAACDVFCTEPPTRENPLIGLPNFFATPHIGANTDEALRRVGMRAVEELLAILQGGRARNEIGA